MVADLHKIIGPQLLNWGVVIGDLLPFGNNTIQSEPFSQPWKCIEESLAVVAFTIWIFLRRVESHDSRVMAGSPGFDDGNWQGDPKAGTPMLDKGCHFEELRLKNVILNEDVILSTIF